MSDEIKESNTPNHILSALGDLTNGAINYCQLPKVTLEEQKMILDYITNLQKIEREYSSLLSENAELQQENENLKDFNNKLQATKDRLDKYDRENQLEIDRLNNIINGLQEEIEIYIDITIDHLETNNEEINFELRNKCRAMREIKDDILNIIKKLKENK